MERIKEAIERARKQAPGQGVRHHPWTPPARMSPLPPKEDVGDVSYSQTRVIKLNPAHLEKNRIVAFNKSDPFSVSFDLLRTQVLRKMEENAWRTLAIISPTPECGKTVVAINLAMSIAQQASKTAVLVDFDLRRPRVGAYLGITGEKSLYEVLNGEVELPEAMVNPGLQRLVVLPSFKPVEGSAEVLASKKVEGLIEDLRGRYKERVILFDLPPLINSDDAITVLPQIDCALMVVGNGMVSKAELEEALRYLHATNLLGVVLNKAEAQPASYYS